MTTFSALGHEKVQLFVGDVAAKAAALEAAGYPVMRRRSTAVSSDDPSGAEVAVGHAMVPVGGKVWDFVGVLSAQAASEGDQSNDSASAAAAPALAAPALAAAQAQAETLGFVAWAAAECPAAHSLGVGKHALGTLAATVAAASASTASPAAGGAAAAWISVSTAASDVGSAGVTTVLSHLSSVTGAAVATTHADAHCSVKEASWLNQWENAFGGNQGEHVYFKYVHNQAHQTIGPAPAATATAMATAAPAAAASTTAATSSKLSNAATPAAALTVGDYEAYVAAVHARYLDVPLATDADVSKRWRGWDHWLDTHVGVK